MESQTYLIALIASISIVALTFLYTIICKGGLIKDSIDLSKQVIPNLIASLLAFVLVYAFIDRVFGPTAFLNISSEASFQQLSTQSPEDIKKEINHLNSQRNEIINQIRNLSTPLSEAKTAQEKSNIENQLSALLSNLAVVESRVSTIEKYLSIANNREEKSAEIARLSRKIIQLEGIIAENKISATAIIKSAEK